MDSSETEYRLVWYIENYSNFKSFQLWLESPSFTMEGLERTSWSLGMDSEFLADPNLGAHSVWLQRSSEDEGPEKIRIKFEITATTANGSILYLSEHDFGKGVSRSLVHMDKLCPPRNTDLLPRDTVVVYCRMWRGEGSAEKVTQCTARSHAAFEQSSFLLKAENFSNVEINKANTFREIPSLSNSGCSGSAFLKTSKRDEDSIIVDIDSLNDGYRVDKKALFVIDASGNSIEVDDGGDFEDDDSDSEDDDDSEDNGDGDFKEDGGDHENNLPKLTRQFILSNKEKYLPNDQLTLLCELTVWHEECISDKTLHDIPMATYLAKYTNVDNNVTEHCPCPNEPENGNVMENDHSQSNENSNERQISTGNIATPRAELNQIEVTNMQEETNSDAAKLPSFPSITDDLKALYMKQLLTDVELKTATKSFPAHKLVLCVRSSVFRSMLADNTKSIEVEDMDNETVNKFLLFLYTDNLEDLQLEIVMQLYRAGVKYDIEPLKETCLTFLLNNLSTSNTSELLLLAETHVDAKLKRSVNRFILEHEEEVFISEEWKNLVKTNPQLGIETMMLKYERKE